MSMSPDPQPTIFLCRHTQLEISKPPPPRNPPSAWVLQIQEVHEAILALVTLIGKVVAGSSAQPAAVPQPLQEAVTRLHDDAILVSLP